MCVLSGYFNVYLCLCMHVCHFQAAPEGPVPSPWGLRTLFLWPLHSQRQSTPSLKELIPASRSTNCFTHFNISCHYSPDQDRNFHIVFIWFEMSVFIHVTLQSLILFLFSISVKHFSRPLQYLSLSTLLSIFKHILVFILVNISCSVIKLLLTVCTHVHVLHRWVLICSNNLPHLLANHSLHPPTSSTTATEFSQLSPVCLANNNVNLVSIQPARSGCSAHAT